MKLHRWTVCLILTLAIVLGIYASERPSKQEIILLNKINGLYGLVDALSLQANNNSRDETETLAKRLEELIRENEVLQEENSDLKVQLKTFGEFWKGMDR